MITLIQNYKHENGDLIESITHIYSPDGYFERNGYRQGWHIQLGTDDTTENYKEMSIGEYHPVPDSLPDIIIPDPPEEEATIEDYQAALEALGVNFGGGNND